MSRSIVAILLNIRSLHNVGSMFRTADGAGIAKLYLCGITPAPVDRLGVVRGEIAKTALGAERAVPWESVRSAAIAIRRLRREGYAICALEQSPKSISLFSKYAGRNDKKICLIVGNEVMGIPKRILESADRVLEIPMRGTKESLNVSVAFGIAVYQLNSPRLRGE